MPSSDSAALIVARFLKSNHYSQSFQAFISEAGLPFSAGTVAKGDLTLETLLEEKKTFDIAVRFEKLGEDGEVERGWRKPAPATGEIVTTLPTSSNILSTIVVQLATGCDAGDTRAFLVATTADRHLNILALPSLVQHASYASLSDSPILSCSALNTTTLLCTTMSGALITINLAGQILDKRKDHSKYVVACAVFQSLSSEGQVLVATAAWDNKVHIYRPSSLTETSFTFGDPIATLALPTKPESLLFLSHPDTADPILLLSRTDSSFLWYYTIPTTPSSTMTTDPQLLGKQNLAPHSNAWVAFTPSSLALHPTDPTLLAVGTNSIPHMKVLIVRLLIPPISSSISSNTPSTAATSAISSLLDPSAAPQETQASQARAALAVADRENVAILIHANTMAPQTAYSTPCVVWRPDGSGVWVNGDDGIVRGVEMKTGKVVAPLGGLGWYGQGKGEGHEAGSKVRCLAAGMEGAEGGKGEVMVSGGFDQRLIVWRSERA